MASKPSTTIFDRLFGTKAAAARTVSEFVQSCHEIECRGKACPIFDVCEYGVKPQKVERWFIKDGTLQVRRE